VLAKRRPAVDEGYSLIEVLERSTDPAKWANHMKIERGCVEIGVIPAPFSPVPSISSDDEDWYYWEKLSTARKNLSRKLSVCLRSGEWLMTGILEPVSAASKRVLIAPHLWDILEPDFEDSSARASNLGYVAVRGHQSKRALASAKSRSVDLRRDADIRTRIQKVHAAAQRVCTQKDRAIGLKPLAEVIKGTGDYRPDTIRSILNGAYKPARIRGFSRFVWKRSKQ
jgi:hypothetical protein